MKYRSRGLALACSLALVLCALLVRPYAETGMMDDWSYVRSAQLFASTGHVIYNGWATAMLGWQLLWGALFFKLFGFSFLTARLSILMVAMATVFLTHRCMVRSGINEWNAALGTLAIVLTPVMLPLSLSFMTDIPGMLILMLCLYACIRALQADTTRAQIAWICFAAISNAIGGTVRQIAWVGVLILVPSTIWMLRKKSRIAGWGILSCVAGICFLFASLHWFNQQPYSVGDAVPRRIGWRAPIFYLPANLLRPALETALFLLPITFMFVPVLWQSRRRVFATLAGCGVFGACAAAWIFAARAMWPQSGHQPGLSLLAPFMTLHGNYVTQFGLYARWPIHYDYPVVLHDGVRVLLTIATLVSVAAVCATIARMRPLSNAEPAPKETLSDRQIATLILPVTAAYCALVLPRAFIGYALDRYLLPLMPLLLILLLRLYQSRISRRLPWPSLCFVLVVGVYSIAATHDLFSLYRTSLTAINEVRAAGVPRDQIDGGWEYDGWTQIEESPYIHQPGIHLPDGMVFDIGSTQTFCRLDYLPLMPSIVPHYSLALSLSACAGATPFAPVSYRRWLSPHSATVYVVNNPVTENTPN